MIFPQLGRGMVKGSFSSPIGAAATTSTDKQSRVAVSRLSLRAPPMSTNPASAQTAPGFSIGRGLSRIRLPNAHADAGFGRRLRICAYWWYKCGVPLPILPGSLLHSERTRGNAASLLSIRSRKGEGRPSSQNGEARAPDVQYRGPDVGSLCRWLAYSACRRLLPDTDTGLELRFMARRPHQQRQSFRRQHRVVCRWARHVLPENWNNQSNSVCGPPRSHARRVRRCKPGFLFSRAFSRWAILGLFKQVYLQPQCLVVRKLLTCLDKGHSEVITVVIAAQTPKAHD